MLMGLREYARHRKAGGLKGGTLGAVQKAIASGRIQAVDGKVDAAAADAAWAASTNAALQRGPVVEAPKVLPILEGVVETAPSALSRRPWGDEPFPAIDAAAPPANVVDGSTFMAAKTRREQAEAELAQLKLARERKLVIDSAEATKAFTAFGRMYSAARENVPAQLAPKLVGLTDLREIGRIVRDAYRAADRRVAEEIRSRYADFADAVAAG